MAYNDSKSYDKDDYDMCCNKKKIRNTKIKKKNVLMSIIVNAG